MLWLIGCGIWEPKDMSLKAYEILNKVDKIYLEDYTSKTAITKEALEELLGRKVIKLDREKVENYTWLLKEAKVKDIALIIKGDVFAATTHYSLYADAKKQKLNVAVIHGSSIFTAIGKVGLSLYRYGVVVSLPHPSLFPEYPRSPFEKIKKNIAANTHTLVILDVGMKVKEALDLIDEYLGNIKVVVCYGLGGNEEKVIKGRVKELKEKTKDLNDKASCIIIPAKELEFYEEGF